MLSPFAPRDSGGGLLHRSWPDILSSATGVVMTIRHTPHQLRGAARVERAVGGGPRFDPPPVLWHHLESYPRLSSRFAVHRGIRWTSPKRRAAQRGRCRLPSRTAWHVRQFALPDPAFVDHRQVQQRRGTDLSWDRAKLVVNSARPTAASWCIATGLDRKGLACSEQFFGL